MTLMRSAPSGPLVANPSYPSPVNNVNAGAVASVDATKGAAQRLTLSASCNVTVTGLVANQPTWLQMKVVQGGAGSFVPTFVGARPPGGIPLTYTATPGSEDIVELFWDGLTLYIWSVGKNFQ